MVCDPVPKGCAAVCNGSQVWSVHIPCAAHAVPQWCAAVCNGAQVWSVHIPCAAQYRNGVQLLLEQVDAVRRMIAASGRTELVTTPAGGYSWGAAGHDPRCETYIFGIFIFKFGTSSQKTEDDLNEDISTNST